MTGVRPPRVAAQIHRLFICQHHYTRPGRARQSSGENSEGEREIIKSQLEMNRLFLANPVDNDTGDAMHPRVQEWVHFAPAVYRAIMALCRCTDAAKGQMLDIFSATKKKGRLVKSPVAMHTFHIFLRL